MKTKQRQVAVIAGALVIGIGIAAYAFLAGKHPASAGAVPVAAMNLQEEVDSEGTVQAAQDVELSFQRSGKISRVNAAANQAVAKGQLIASLDTTDLAAQRESAEAALQSQQLKLQGLEPSGSAGSSVQTTIANGRSAVADKITDGYVKADTALSANADALFSDPKTNPIFGKTVTVGSTVYTITAESQAKNALNAERIELTSSMQEWSALNQNLSTDAGITAASAQAERTLMLAQKFLTDVAAALNTTVGADASFQNIVAGYAASIASARTNVDTALTNLRTAEQAYASAQDPASSYSVQLQQAAVKSAQAQVDAVDAAISQGTIQAPFDGVIIMQDAKVGQIASPGTPVVRLISGDKLQAETYVSQIDVGKLAVGMKATVSLDSYGPSKAWNATVVSVDTGETAQNGVNAYKAVLQFDDADPLIKSGMGANVHFQISSKQGVLAVPKEAVISKDGKSYVELRDAAGALTEQEIQTGIAGSNGYVEVVSGLAAGDSIITFSAH